MSLDSPLSVLLYLAALWFMVFPLTTFLHECGHALVVLLLTHLPVMIVLGDQRKGLKWQWGRLGVSAGWNIGFVGFIRYNEQQLTRRQGLAVTLAGPAVSLLLTVLLGSLSGMLREPQWVRLAVTTLTYAAAAQLLFTLLPVRYPRWLPGYAGKTSDGWRALQLLRTTR